MFLRVSEATFMFLSALRYSHECVHVRTYLFQEYLELKEQFIDTNQDCISNKSHLTLMAIYITKITTMFSRSLCKCWLQLNLNWKLEVGFELDH